MTISGQKTESIYRRYDIVAHRDLVDAAARIEQYLETVKGDRMGTLSGTPEGEQQDSCTTNSQKFLN